jgi:hypothetical protein
VGPSPKNASEVCSGVDGGQLGYSYQNGLNGCGLRVTWIACVSINNFGGRLIGKDFAIAIATSMDSVTRSVPTTNSRVFIGSGLIGALDISSSKARNKYRNPLGSARQKLRATGGAKISRQYDESQ